MEQIDFYLAAINRESLTGLMAVYRLAVIIILPLKWCSMCSATLHLLHHIKPDVAPCFKTKALVYLESAFVILA